MDVPKAGARLLGFHLRPALSSRICHLSTLQRYNSRTLDDALRIAKQIVEALEAAKVLFQRPYYWGLAATGRPYDIGPDGRLLMIKEVGVEPPSIRVVLNWHKELKRLVPTR